MTSYHTAGIRPTRPTIENVRTLKRADQLAVGDKREGTSKYEKTERVVWHVTDVQEKIDPVLGRVIQINFTVHAPDGSFLWENHEIFLRPSERIWVLS